MRRHPGSLIALMTWLALAGIAAVVPARALGQDVVARTGVLIFFGGPQQTRLPVPIASLRRSADRIATAALKERATAVAAADSVEIRAGRWRVRSALSITPGFLGDLRDGLGVDDLVIVQLHIDPDRLTLLARAVATATGRVHGVWLAEQALATPLLGDDVGAETLALQRGLETVVAALAAPPDASAGPGSRPGSALLLPPEAVGVEPELALVALHCLLAQMVGADRERPVDPGVAVAAIWAGQHDPYRLDAAARGDLARTFEADTMLLAQLVSYADDTRTGRAAIRDPEAAAAGPVPVGDFSLTLRAATLADGFLRAGAAAHRDRRDEVGWFGRVDTTPLLVRLQEAAAALWTEFHAQMEDF